MFINSYDVFDFIIEKLIVIINKVYKSTNVIEIKNITKCVIECAKISNLENLLYLVSESIRYSF